jgi:hypothetical protein
MNSTPSATAGDDVMGLPVDLFHIASNLAGAMPSAEPVLALSALNSGHSLDWAMDI